MDFKTFFAIDKKDIQRNCIICQNYDLSLFSNKISNGFFVKCANTANATVIALKNNFLAGDTILYLKNTICENIFLFGSCGGCNGRDYGDMLIVDKAYNFESFSDMLNSREEINWQQTTQHLYNAFSAKNAHTALIKTNTACVSSLLLERNFLKWFKEKQISITDMESSIVLSAAKHINKNAIILTYVADIIGQELQIKINIKNKQKIAFSRKKLSQCLTEFCSRV
ncbi:MAG: hypothetical protein LBL71_03030 [Endomicrobium sp.]|jgi:nucleoside phosphorylase|nr:hypothetical protein [Endomicrobium sp.]